MCAARGCAQRGGRRGSIRPFTDVASGDPRGCSAGAGGQSPAGRAGAGSAARWHPASSPPGRAPTSVLHHAGCPGRWPRMPRAGRRMRPGRSGSAGPTGSPSCMETNDDTRSRQRRGERRTRHPQPDGPLHDVGGLRTDGVSGGRPGSGRRRAGGMGGIAGGRGRRPPRHVRRLRPARGGRRDALAPRPERGVAAGRDAGIPPHRRRGRHHARLVGDGHAPARGVQPRPRALVHARHGAARLAVRLPVRPLVRVVSPPRGRAARDAPRARDGRAGRSPASRRTPLPRSRSTTGNGSWRSSRTSSTTSWT